MGVEYKLLGSIESARVNKLLSVYGKNPYLARVLYFNDRSEYFTKRLVLFTQENGDFELVYYKRSYGISVTNKRYSHEKKVSSIIYKGKKFYAIITNGDRTKLVQLTFGSLLNFKSEFNYGGIKDVTETFFSDLKKRFTWLRFVEENRALHNLSFNSIIKYKLYNLNDALRHIYGVPLTVIKEILKNDNSRDNLRLWKINKPYLSNIENLKSEFLSNHLFYDTLNMARILDKRVNCSWSLKRLALEHDKWSKEITNTLIELEPLEDLKILNIYHDFAKFSGYKLLLTNKEVMHEGMVQRHCVATYISKINSGYCAIYHIDGYTLELRSNGMNLVIYQFRGKYNVNAPDELYDSVKDMINKFLGTYKHKQEQNVCVTYFEDTHLLF